MDTFYTDLLCVGAGLAGERVAVAAASAGFETICLSIVPPRRSHSSAAQGGMQASLGNCCMGEGDCPDVHFADTVKGSDWGCDQEVCASFRGHCADCRSGDGILGHSMEPRRSWKRHLL